MWILILMINEGYPAPRAALTTVAPFANEQSCKDAGNKAKLGLYNRVDFTCISREWRDQ